MRRKRGKGFARGLVIGMSVFICIAMGVGNSFTKTLVWAGTGDSTNFQTFDSASSTTNYKVFGPYSGWTPMNYSYNSDGTKALLWSGPGGYASVWTLDCSNNVTTYKVYGPYAGWSPVSFSSNSDGTRTLLWSGTGGYACIWTLDSSNNVKTYKLSGGYTGWTAVSYSSNNNGTGSLLWAGSGGYACVWALDSSNTMTTYSAYGPYPGWTAVNCSSNSDGTRSLLWSAAGYASVWTLDSSNKMTTYSSYGPYTNWSPVSYSSNSDGTGNLLWSGTGGYICIWTLDSSDNMTAYNVSGPYNAATPVSYSYIPSSGTGTLLWSGTGGYAAVAVDSSNSNHADVTAQPNVGSDIQPYFNTPGNCEMDSNTLANLVQQKIKYVFVIFNENHSFDNEYGTFPGVNGIYSDGTNPRSAGNTPGFSQTYTDKVSGAQVTVQPFKIGPNQNSTVVDSVDHSHTGLATKIDLVNGTPQMDKFAYDEYIRFGSKGGAANNAMGTQYARLVMSHVDCDTIPFFWQWASRFTIFDNIFATEDTPSTPNAVAMIAGQSGETQWVKHGPNGKTYTVGSHTGTTQGPPLVNDPQPFYGSQFDTTTTNKQPAGPKESYADNNIASNLTFASLPLTFMGKNITSVLAGNLNSSFDLPDIQNDIPYIQGLATNPVNWRWYQEGYDLESTDTSGKASFNSYVSHHQGPQYFGYVANTPAASANMRGMTDFFNDMAGNTLPQGGVFYIRGGYTNQMGLKPAITNANTPAAEITAINAAKAGDDDHPSYTDRQLSEAMAARVINAVASNPNIWNQCAIIITYDESDGFYDHVPPRILSYGPDALPLSRGVRVPLILISPYARVHAVSHVEGDHNSVIETINNIFGLPALSSLPDEANALAAGNSAAFNQFGPSGFQQKYLGPRDTNSPISESLLSGFDPQRLAGTSPLVPASFATIPDSVLNPLPHYQGQGCQEIGITPEDVRQGIVNNIPTGFNPLPSTYPAAN